MTTLATAGPRYTPADLAKLLPLKHAPTDEQAAIIAAQVAPVLVVAGAGSGKTETMASRVVWLVANDYVRPEQILGLTFTRKAAGELATRVRLRLGQLHRKLGEADLVAGEPAISTYHSYAARIVTEHGVRAGYEPTSRLLSTARSWQIADTVVRSYTGDMALVDKGPAYVTDAVLHLAEQLAEHLRTPDDLAAWTGRFFAEVTAPPGRMYADVTKTRAIQQARLALMPLVRAYTQRKRDFEAMDFGDQLARAAHVAITHTEVGAIERDRYRVVLLDEYQDTSHAQVALLRALFGGGHPVTAVGDPCQSIYGWRGASAGTLDRFPDEFTDRRGRPALALTLSTSFRNRAEILTVANAMLEPLRAVGHHVTRLRPSEAGRAPRSGTTVRCALLETAADEAGWIAERIEAEWRARTHDAPARSAVEKRPSTAVLVRKRAQIAQLERALRARGLPVEIVGLGGLLDTPEVRDVVSTLEVLADPLAGAALLRLLTGPRWRIGPRDIVALYRRATALLTSRRTGVPDPESPDPDDQPHAAIPAGGVPGVASAAALGVSPDGAPLIAGRLDEAALIDALDDLGTPSRYSDEGFRRYTLLATELRSLRLRLDQPLPDLIADIEREMGLDVEVSVRASDTALARAHLDAFAETAAQFSAEAQGATVSAFLAFLAAAESEEHGLAAGETEVVDGAIQILTVHAAKGLEWDIVAVAGLSKGTFPSPSTNGDQYLGGLGVLPFPLRGDRAGLPRLDVMGAGDQKAVKAALDGFTDDWRAHSEREERRLAYVAVTRPRSLLLCSAYWWAPDGVKPRGPSAFLTDVRDTCIAEGSGVVDVWTPQPEDDATNPALEHVEQAVWPADPLGADRAVVEQAAAMVRAAGPGETRLPDPGSLLQDPAPETDPAVVDELARWAYETELLLAERDRIRPVDGAVDVTLPSELSVSNLVSLRHDPQGLARRLRRPMPVRPDPYTRRGTAFHRWLEQRYGANSLLDLDELPGAGDENAAADDELATLQEQFLASEWADRSPVAVEVPFATSVAGVVIRGRMDAVFDGAPARGGKPTFDVVDWKTGRRPAGRAARDAAIQLGAYRLAWAQLAGVPVERVRAAFYYVRDNVTVRPVDLINADGLVALVAGLPEAAGRAPAAPSGEPQPQPEYPIPVQRMLDEPVRHTGDSSDAVR